MFLVISGCYLSKKYEGKAPGEDEKKVHFSRVVSFSAALDLIAALGILAVGIYGLATGGQCAISLTAARVAISIGSIYTFLALIINGLSLCAKNPEVGNRTFCRVACSGRVN